MGLEEAARKESEASLMFPPLIHSITSNFSGYIAGMYNVFEKNAQGAGIGLFNVVKGESKGVWIGGLNAQTDAQGLYFALGNAVRENARGLLVAGANLINGKVQGLLLAAGNLIFGEVKGISAGLIGNYAERLKSTTLRLGKYEIQIPSLQIGIANYTEKVDGPYLQIGLINISPGKMGFILSGGSGRLEKAVSITQPTTTSNPA